MPVLERQAEHSSVSTSQRIRPGQSGSGRVIPTADTLAGINAFHGLSKEQRQALVPRCHCRHYETGQDIVTYHDDTHDVYFIISGQVQATIFSVTGKQVALGDIGPGIMFGELSAIDGEPRSAHVVALTDVMICSMSPDDFWYVLETYPAVARATLRRLTTMVRHLCERVFEISTLPVKHRIHAELLRLALQHMSGDNKAVISPAPTQTDIANHIGTHREGVTREMTRLRNSGLIERRSNRLYINDIRQLRLMVQQVAGLTGNEESS